MLAFYRDNARWIAAGFVLLLCSSFGQTFFISLSAGEIRREYGLSHGGFASLYMAATLLSAAVLPLAGALLDRWSLTHILSGTLLLLAAATACMAVSTQVAGLFIALLMLRLFGQGMAAQTAFTAMGRWFSADRGKAMSLATLGMNAGQAALPPLFLLLSSAWGWRAAWIAAGLLLVFVAWPVAAALTARERPPDPPATTARPTTARDWTRAQVLRDPLFRLVMLAMLPPALVGNTVFFHQVHLAELRGWPLGTLAAAFPLMAGLTVLFSQLGGRWIDRHSARSLLPVYLLPMGLGCLALAALAPAWALFVFMALFGMSDGLSLVLFGTLWPELYGTRHLGAIRSVIVGVMVCVSALGPGLSGLWIDAGLPYPLLLGLLGAYCLIVSLLMKAVLPRLHARVHPGRTAA